MRAESVDLAHQSLTFECPDRSLIRYREKNAHRAIGRRERLLLLDRVIFRKWFQRRAEHSERVELELKLRARRTCFHFLMEPMQARADFRRVQDRYRLVKLARLEVQ